MVLGAQSVALWCHGDTPARQDTEGTKKVERSWETANLVVSQRSATIGLEVYQDLRQQPLV